MKITLKFLNFKNACKSGIDFVRSKKLLGLGHKKFILKLMEYDKFSYANWLIVRLMEYREYVSYAVYAAELVIDIYEKNYPENKRLRLALVAAKKCIDEPTEENKKAADAAADAADAAAYAAADAAYAAAYAAADAAYVAAYAAADAAADAAAHAADAAADAAAHADIKVKIINYGLELIRNGKK
jgi:hypothetical protein